MHNSQSRYSTRSKCLAVFIFRPLIHLFCFLTTPLRMIPRLISDGKSLGQISDLTFIKAIVWEASLTSARAIHCFRKLCATQSGMYYKSALFS